MKRMAVREDQGGRGRKLVSERGREEGRERERGK